MATGPLNVFEKSALNTSFACAAMKDKESEKESQEYESKYSRYNRYQEQNKKPDLDRFKSLTLNVTINLRQVFTIPKPQYDQGKGKLFIPITLIETFKRTDFPNDPETLLLTLPDKSRPIYENRMFNDTTASFCHDKVYLYGVMEEYSDIARGIGLVSGKPMKTKNSLVLSSVKMTNRTSENRYDHFYCHFLFVNKYGAVLDKCAMKILFLAIFAVMVS